MGKPKKERQKLTKWQAVVLFMLLPILALAIGESKPTPRDLKIEAVVYCKDLVKASLKAPSTADFPWSMEATATGDFYTVKSYVDAQNAFGAMLRTHFFCQLKHNGKAGWAVHEMRVLE